MDNSRQAESRKWGDALRFGWTGIPNLLLRKQSELGLTSDHMIVLINLIRFWWRYDKFPFPSIKKTASETGISENKLVSIIDELEKKGLLRKVGIGGGEFGYDISPLSKKLQEYSVIQDNENEPGMGVLKNKATEIASQMLRESIQQLVISGHSLSEAIDIATKNFSKLNNSNQKIDVASLTNTKIR